MRVALVVVLLSVVALAPSTAVPCHDASQLQLYPLGLVGRDLIALQLHKAHGGKERATLSIEAELVLSSGRGRPRRLRRLGRYRLAGRSLQRVLGPVLTRALARAVALPGYRALRMYRWETCEHRHACAGATRLTRKHELAVGLEGVRRAVGWPLSMLYNKPGDYTIASVRRFVAGSARWAIVDLSAGNPMCNQVNEPARRECARKKQLRRRPDRRTPALSADRPPLHHGHDIAVAVRLPPKQ